MNNSHINAQRKRDDSRMILSKKTFAKIKADLKKEKIELAEDCYLEICRIIDLCLNPAKYKFDQDGLKRFILAYEELDDIDRVMLTYECQKREAELFDSEQSRFPCYMDIMIDTANRLLKIKKRGRGKPSATIRPLKIALISEMIGFFERRGETLPTKNQNWFSSCMGTLFSDPYLVKAGMGCNQGDLHKFIKSAKRLRLENDLGSNHAN